MNRHLVVSFCILGFYFISNSLSYIAIPKNKGKYLNQNLKGTPTCLYHDCDKHLVLKTRLYLFFHGVFIIVVIIIVYLCIKYFRLCEREMWKVAAGESRTSIGQDYKRLVVQRSLGSSILRRGLFLVSKGRGNNA